MARQRSPERREPGSLGWGCWGWGRSWDPRVAGSTGPGAEAEARVRLHPTSSDLVPRLGNAPLGPQEW